MTRARKNANISPAIGRNLVINGAKTAAQRNAEADAVSPE